MATGICSFLLNTSLELIAKVTKKTEAKTKHVEPSRDKEIMQEYAPGSSRLENKWQKKKKSKQCLSIEKWLKNQRKWHILGI